MTGTPSAATATSVAEQYAALRTSVGWCTPYTSLVRLTGMERARILARLLARDSEFVEPDTVRDSLVLNEDGSIHDVVTHIELDDASWLLSQSRADLAETVEETAGTCGVTDAVTVTDASGDHVAIAFEGPASWRVAEHLVDEEISGLVLHGVTHARLADTDCLVARTGTTGEYGYVLIAPRPADAPAWVDEQAARFAGGRVEDTALSRARAEVRHPVLPDLTAGLSVREAGLEWLASWSRADDFRGARALASTTDPEHGLTLVVAAGGPAPEPGTALFAGECRVGEIRWAAPEVGGPALAYALLDVPFAVPGLDLTTETGGAVRTTASPIVVPTSWSVRLGD
ncbi:aminomethyl transferase family protein [Streptomyces sp. NPDC052040]|uniref:aminomethyl transferase family protein n=1 Tax=unclassified Streptomyces TaxID=2593676 RepID=UPI0037CF13B1